GVDGHPNSDFPRVPRAPRGSLPGSHFARPAGTDISSMAGRNSAVPGGRAMRVFAYSLVGLLIAAAAASAQPAPAENLDTVLRGWEKAMTDLRSFVCVIERTTLDKALGAKDEFKGYSMFMKPATKEGSSRARLELGKVSNPKVFEKYICTGT